MTGGCFFKRADSSHVLAALQWRYTFIQSMLIIFLAHNKRMYRHIHRTPLFQLSSVKNDPYNVDLPFALTVQAPIPLMH